MANLVTIIIGPIGAVALVACGSSPPVEPPPDGGESSSATSSATGGSGGVNVGGSGGTGSGSTSSNGCAIGLVDCNEIPADGCEINTRIDPFNCGGCGIKCGLGEACENGSCSTCAVSYNCETAGTAENGWNAWPVIVGSPLHVLAVDVRTDSGGDLYALTNENNAPGDPIAWNALKTSSAGWWRADISFDVKAKGGSLWIATNAPVYLCESRTALAWHSDSVKGPWGPSADPAIPIRVNGYCYVYNAPDCSSGACSDRCADCDGNPANGCETSLELANNCGACTDTCSAPTHCGPGCTPGAPFTCHESFDCTD